MLIGIGKGSVNVDDTAHGIGNRLGNPNGWAGTGSGNCHGNCIINRIDIANDTDQEMVYVLVMFCS